SQVSRLEDRPRLFGFFGAVFALSSLIGPLIGGTFTDHVTWRWVFWINLPIGGVSVCAVVLLRSSRDILQQVVRLDFVGAILVTCLVLALQWGGNTKTWDDKDVIICFVFAGTLVAAYVVWEIYIGDGAMTPTTIFKSRSIWAILAYCFLARFSLLLFSYYIPIFYQAVQHHSVTNPGIDLLPFMLGVVLTVVSSGQMIGRWSELQQFHCVEWPRQSDPKCFPTWELLSRLESSFHQAA
ncbi:major facilitator superfamily domain-containing protein, partial [Mycena sp. CBHHK59/15]